MSGEAYKKKSDKIVVAKCRDPEDITAEDREVVAKAQSFFSGGKGSMNREDRMSVLEEVYEDAYFRGAAVLAGRRYAADSGHPVYEYLYDHRASFSLYNIVRLPPWKMILLVGTDEGQFHSAQLQTTCFMQFGARAFGLDLFPDPPGACHADEALIMFPNAGIPVAAVRTDADRAANRNLWRLWTNFAKELTPTLPGEEVQWTP